MSIARIGCDGLEYDAYVNDSRDTYKIYKAYQDGYKVRSFFLLAKLEDIYNGGPNASTK